VEPHRWFHTALPVCSLAICHVDNTDTSAGALADSIHPASSPAPGCILEFHSYSIFRVLNCSWSDFFA
jgi:hypothetical protein